jgi:osmoprotectant transport system permease protein
MVDAAAEHRAVADTGTTPGARRGQLGAAGVGAEDLLAELGGPSRWWRWIGTPLLLAGACLVLYLYVQSQQLDRIEAAALNAPMIRQRLVEHLQLTAVSTFFVIVIAVPLGLLATRPATRRLTPVFLAVANVGQAVPSIGVLVLLAVSVGIGFEKAIYALVLYAILPVLRNTMVGLDQVDRSLLESGRGMGLTSLQVLRRIELPLAVPVMLAGIRTALILNVGSAALATFIGAGGLGWIINQGNIHGRTTVLLTGSALAAIVALTIDWGAGLVEDALRPKGI